MNNRAIVFDTEDDVSKMITDFVNSGVDIEKGIYPGVTRILSATSDNSGIEAWRQSVGEEEADRILKESQEIGNSPDDLLLKSFLPDFDKNLYKHEISYYLYVQLSMSLRKIKPIALQLKIWSEDLKVMGYLDCLGYYEGELSLIDFKNTRKIKKPEHYHNYLLQCTIYCLILKKLFGINVRQIILLMGVRDSVAPQIIKERTKDYVKEAYARIIEYHAINDGTSNRQSTK